MAEGERENGGGGAWSEFWLIVGLLAVLVLFWYVSGKPGANTLGSLTISSPISTSTPHNWLPFWGGATVSSGSNSSYSYKPPTNTFGSVSLPGFQTSALEGEIMIEEYDGARASDPEEQYITLYANPGNSGSIDLSGWQLRSIKTGQSVRIPGAVETALLGEAQSPGDVTLAPGDTAVVTTGRSPIGVSFLENECSQYLAQFQLYTPGFSLACPLPESEIQNTPLAQDQSCTEAVAGVSPCHTPTSAPSGVSQQCSDFMVSRFSYNGCVLAHQNDTNFEGKQWRIFLGLQSTLWNSTGDTIALLDPEGHLVATVTY
ncbi:MAG: lamin tail domain-containing protein [Patescibacteria group bacterium]|nr:lamin tail domain-containing protein [Patescibacteria group bacterium]